MSTIEVYRFDTFFKFVSDFSKILFSNGIFEREKYIFRGHGDSNFKLRASFDRRFIDMNPADRVNHYRQLTRLLREELNRCGVQVDNDDMALGLAQHYGTPTRLLDWSSSPLVAAYFAFHSNLSAEKPSKFVSIWALRIDDQDAWSDLGMRILRLESPNNKRAERQLGFATNLVTANDTLEEFFEAIKPSKPALWRFDINAQDANATFAFLDACNTRASALFGEAEGAARTAFERLVLSNSISQ